LRVVTTSGAYTNAFSMPRFFI